MKTEQIILKLESIINNPDDYLALQDMNSLIQTLKDDLKMQSAKKTTKNSKLSAIKKVLNDKNSKCRPVLSKYDIQGDKMVFTNSYIGFRINDLEANPFIKANPDEHYPNMDFIFKRAEAVTEEDVFKIDYSEIKALQKQKIQFYKINDSLSFDVNYLIYMLDIMPEDTVYYLHDKMIHALNSRTDEQALLIGAITY